MSELSMLTEEQAAEYIGMSVHYLRKDRTQGQIGNRTPGPRYMKLGKRVRYHKDDLDAWLQSCRMPTHAERAQRRSLSKRPQSSATMTAERVHRLLSELDYLTTPEAADYCRVSENQFREHATAMGIMPVKFTGKILYRKADLKSVLENTWIQVSRGSAHVDRKNRR